MFFRKKLKFKALEHWAAWYKKVGNVNKLKLTEFTHASI